MGWGEGRIIESPDEKLPEHPKDWKVRVPLVLPGELAKVRIFKNFDHHSEADLLEIVETVAERVKPVCPLAGTCGGCQFQHMKIEIQRQWKTDFVKRGLMGQEIKGYTSEEDILAKLLPCMGTKEIYGYRSKITPHYQAPMKVGDEEYEMQAERKQHLDTQFEDLVSALDTLQSAIRKIDKETRTRFSATFEQVNEGLKQLFPKVFGGGSAYLALTDDDLLETGVTIMARPPGKKNSTIHLLSGGEKALTALSLVFAIFRLNPAPFCLLDEVDAPLDDANVGRFCNLVSEMSQTVQFIYITHNKIAMEMASHLTGVTMAEPGVSRMVAVDVDEAVAFAEA